MESEMNVYVLKKHYGSYEEYTESLEGVFSSFEFAFNKILELEKVVDMVDYIDDVFSNEWYKETKPIFYDPLDDDNKAYYSFTEIEFNK